MSKKLLSNGKVRKLFLLVPGALVHRIEMAAVHKSHAASASAIGNAVAVATAQHVKLDGDSQLSVKDLKKSLRVALAGSGVLSDIKSQLRREFIANMKGMANGAPSAYEQSKRTLDLSTRITFSTVYHMLKSRGLQHSLAVFSAETGLEASKMSLLSERDIVHAMNLDPNSPVYQQIEEKETAASPLKQAGNKGIYSEKENRGAKLVGSLSSTNLLDLLLEQTFRRAKKNMQDSVCQTDSDAFKHTTRQALDDALKEIHDSFKLVAEEEKKNPEKSVTERMLSYQRDCDDRLKRDLEIQMSLFRDHESTRIRLEESEKARQTFMAHKIEQETTFHRKNSTRESREAELLRDGAERDRLHQMQIYETRQKMQREVDEMRQRELSTGRRFEIEHQGLKMLELQLKDMQAMIETREREVLSREKEVDRRTKDQISLAKEEARDSLRAELEENMRDRKHLALERQRFEDEKMRMLTSLDSLKATRAALADAQDEINLKDQKSETLERALKKAEGIIRGDYVDPNSQQNQLLLTVRRNAELEAQVPQLLAENAKFRDAQTARERAEGAVEAQAREISRLRATCDSAQQKAEKDGDLVESLKDKLEAERVKVISLTLKSKELERLLTDKRKVIASLAGGRNMPTGSAGSGAAEFASGLFGNKNLQPRDLGRDRQQKSYQEVQQQFAFKRAEEFANALIQQRRAGSGSHGVYAAGGAATQGAVSAIVDAFVPLTLQQLASQYAQAPVPAPAPVSPSKNKGSPSSIPRYIGSPTKSPAAPAPAVLDSAALAAAQRKQEREDYLEQMAAEAAAWEVEKLARITAQQAAAQQAQLSAQEQERNIQTQSLEMQRKKLEMEAEIAQLEREKVALSQQKAAQANAQSNTSTQASTIAQEQVTARAAQLLAQQEQQFQRMQEQQAAMQAAQQEDERNHAARMAEIKREQQAAVAAAEARIAAAAAQAASQAQHAPQSPPYKSASSNNSNTSVFGSPIDISNISTSEQGSVVNISTMHNQSADVSDNSALTRLAAHNTPAGAGGVTNANREHRHAPAATHQSPVQGAETQPAEVEPSVSSPDEEAKKAIEDAARIAEARAKVLARRKSKHERDEVQAGAAVQMQTKISLAKSHAAAGGGAGGGPGIGSGGTPPKPVKVLTYSRNDDSDVEITAGNMSNNSDESDGNDGSWF